MLCAENVHRDYFACLARKHGDAMFHELTSLRTRLYQTRGVVKQTLPTQMPKREQELTCENDRVCSLNDDSTCSTLSAECIRESLLVVGGKPALEDEDHPQHVMKPGISCEHNISKWALGHKWAKYRLSDYVLQSEKWARSRSPMRGTLLSELYDALRRGTFNGTKIKRGLVHSIATLAKIVKARLAQRHEDHINDATLVINVRLGDVVDKSVFPLETLMNNHTFYYMRRSKRRWNQYVRPFWVYKKLSHLVVPPPQKVIILAGLHVDPSDRNIDHTRSCIYATELRNLLELMWPLSDVSLRIGFNPDEDVMFAMQAKHFVCTGGGFSRLLAFMVKTISGGRAYYV